MMVDSQFDWAHEIAPQDGDRKDAQLEIRSALIRPIPWAAGFQIEEARAYFQTLRKALAQDRGGQRSP
jgi:hypothetical protein